MGARRTAVSLGVALLLVATVGLVMAPLPVAAQDTETATTLIPLDEQPTRAPSIIPTPNSSSQPTQYGVMAAVVLGLGIIAALIVRESRRNPGRRTHTPQRPTPQERSERTPTE